jgi:hypothetical protein
MVSVNIPKIKPVCVVPLSLEEFRQNKLLTKTSFYPDLRAEPDLFLKEIKNYGLIYGLPLYIQELKFILNVKTYNYSSINVIRYRDRLR